MPATLFFIATAAAIFANSCRHSSQLIAAALLCIAATPFAFRLAGDLLFATNANALQIADSPLGYLVAVVLDGLLSVPPLILAFGVWRRRASSTDIS